MIDAEQVLKLPALWDLTVMPKALEEMLSLLDRSSVGAGADIVVDLGAVERFRWQAMPKNLHELARVYGLSQWFAETGQAPSSNHLESWAQQSPSGASQVPAL
ncbi:MAG: hypothetical protein EBS61_04400 [Betaproteobacteria bacterium]|nr:hypothetical protein [Betaproteobacteria bacterium]